MKKGTKKLIAYGVVGVALYYMFMQTREAHSEVQTMVQERVMPAPQQLDTSELQLFGMGNPPNWY